MNFEIGQVFEGRYPPEAAIWCNANRAYIDVIGTRKYQIKAVPEPPLPTREDIEEMRKAYRREHIDDLTLARVRKQANGTWTQAEEGAYLNLDDEVTAYIEEHYPYPEEITDEQN